MRRALSRRATLGTVIQWIGAVAFLLTFVAMLVTDAVLLTDPLASQPSTQHVIRWGFKGYVRYITPSENYWQQQMWIPPALAFVVICLGIYLNPENEKWPKRFKPKF